MSRVAEFMRFPIKTVFMANNLPFLTGGSAAQTTDSGPSAPTSQDIELATPNRNHYRNSIVTRTLRLRLAFHPGLLHRRGSADCPIMRLSPELILMLMGYLNAYNAEDGFSLGLTCTRFYAIRHEHFGVLDTYCFDRNQFGTFEAPGLFGDDQKAECGCRRHKTARALHSSRSNTQLKVILSTFAGMVFGTILLVFLRVGDPDRHDA